MRFVTEPRRGGAPPRTDHSPRLANVTGAVGLAIADAIRSAESQLPPPADHPSCLAALNLLAWLPGTTAPQLAHALNLSQPATQRVIDRLAEASLIVRELRPGERRLRLRCTPKARRVIRRHRASRTAAVNNALATLTDDEAIQLEHLLDRVAANLAHSSDDALRVCRLCQPTACGDDDECPVWSGYLARYVPNARRSVRP